MAGPTKEQEDALVDEFQSSTLQLDVDALAAEVETKEVPVLVVLSGSRQGEVIPLRVGVVLLGRNDDGDIVIRDEAVSRRHAEITIGEEGVVEVRDLESTNGLFVNDEKVTTGSLKIGDRLRVGKHVEMRLEQRFEHEMFLQQRLSDQLLHDELTGTFSRPYLDAHLHADLSMARRHQEPLSVLMVDIDQLKEINRTYGFEAGDGVIRGVAKLLSRRIRAEDILARYGDDEFVLVLRRTAQEGALALVGSFKDLFGKTELSVHGVRLTVTVSMGLVCCGTVGGAVSPRDLLLACREALQQSKLREGNSVELSDKLTGNAPTP